jgi:hypothetical protein
MMADTDATAGVDEARRGQSADRVRDRRAVQRTFVPSAPSAGIGVVEYPAVFRIRADQFDDEVCLSASTHDAHCIARPHRAAVRWAVENEWRQ